MSLNQLINPSKPIDASFNDLTVEGSVDVSGSFELSGNLDVSGSVSCSSFKDTRDLVLNGVSSSAGGIVASSGFITGYTVNSFTKYTNTSSYIVREVHLSFATDLAAGQVFYFDFQKESGQEEILYISAHLDKGASVSAVFGTVSVGGEPNTIRVTFDYLSAQPATAGAAQMTAHLIFQRSI